MMRFLCREIDWSRAYNLGGPVDTEYRTFTDAAALEAWLRLSDLEHHNYVCRELLGVELVDDGGGK